MVAVPPFRKRAGVNKKRAVLNFNKERRRYHHISTKLTETVEAILNPSSPDNPLQPRLQQALNIVVEDEHNKTPPDSEWVVSIRGKLDKARRDDVGSTWAKICIYKVPYYLKEGDDRSYVPQIASIGPYHHGKNRLPDMDRHKWRSVQQMLMRSKHDVWIYLNALKDIEDRIRACYEKPIGFGSDEFVEMLFLDGCFILELFRGAAEGFMHLGYPITDPIFAMSGLIHAIQRDLIMLENQLPLFVLDLLLGIQVGNIEQEELVSKLALNFFDPLTPTNEPLTSTDYETTFDPQLYTGSLHCLEVFHRGLLGSGPRQERQSPNRVPHIRQRLHLIHCVTELREAGVVFKRRKKGRFWDLMFKNGILKIPQLLIHDGTKSLFLNLIAFEQCHRDCPNNITSYVIFMDNLINSPEDVAYLHSRGIIEHGLGSDAEVADLFNSLCREIVFDMSKCYLSKQSDDVKKYFNRRWNTWLANLKHNYFSNPWVTTSVIAAVILLFLTLAQTVFTIYGYLRPR